MLTLIDALSLAGDRAKQNDDVCGWRPHQAWVIDGATDLHTASLTGAASDASWIAQIANGLFAASEIAPNHEAMRQATRAASIETRAAFLALHDWPKPDWMAPLASLLLVREHDSGMLGLDLGDCRAFALDADGAAHEIGGPPNAADDETQNAARAAQDAGETPLLRHEATLDLLRAGRARQNGGNAGWAFCLKPECADHARVWALRLKRPAHVLIATDGFAALVDRYRLFTSATLIETAIAEGLHALGLRLRAYETEDARGQKHPRWKRSDDATALLLRLE
jgi:hypothetical protein